MKASWSGYLVVANLAVPVRLYSAVRSTSPHFVRLHAKDHSPVDSALICEKEGKEVRRADTVRAIEVGPGKYVEVSDSDIRGTSPAVKTLNVKQFSDPQTIDPIYYEKPYYIVPGKGGELAYTLFREAFDRANKIAIVTYTSYEKEHLGIVRSHEGVLLLQQLRFASEIVPRAEIKTPTLPQPTPEQVEAAVKLMHRYSAPFYIEDYRNEQLESLQELIDRKAKGLPPKRAPRVAPHATPEDKLVPTLNALLGNKDKRYLAY